MYQKIIDEKFSFISMFNPKTGAYVRTGILNEKVWDSGVDPFMASFPHLIDVGIMGHCVHGKTELCVKAGIGCYQSGLVDDLTKIRARILGQNVVYQVISDLRLQEDDAIRRNLDTEKIAIPLKRITHRYERIEIDTNKRILVSDLYNQFDMADLSTGAQEQVLLALRIRFASILLGKEQPFLILDDAFQHSDWNRREYLLEIAMDLANSGCQILYLSMDDHIRELFQTKVKSRFGKKYLYYELEDQSL